MCVRSRVPYHGVVGTADWRMVRPYLQADLGRLSCFSLRAKQRAAAAERAVPSS